ncbi:MAG TPA: 4-coumarate--CoA ligase family protein [Pyrinomonadaceae bacterium]|jgi:acyl-CoA synthetase (AMP-forming)/AMP-acid ligase II|nr:4-coumarate--CoA ligase family protein [Pyrinomonadaceae bacterium]
MLFRGPDADVSIPEIGLTPFVLRHALRLADKPALIDGPTGRVLTYGQLAAGIRRVASGLHARGFRKGDVFGIFSPNVPEYALAFHAVSLLGGVSSPINPQYTCDEVAHQLKDANARFLFTVSELREKAIEAAHRAGVREVFVLGEAEGATPFAALLENDEDEGLPPVEINSHDDLVALPYSSGTTGLPKGVMLTHRNLIANLRQTEAARIINPDDTVLCVLPLYHIYGLVVILNLGLYMGATIVTMPRFELEGFLQILQDYEVTLAPLVPPLVLTLSKNPLVADYDLSKLRMIFSGAAPLSQVLTRACTERIGCIIRQGYGMTETSPVTHISPLDPAQIKAGSVGHCVPNTECKILDPSSGDALGIGEEGEICIRGPQVMKGYLNRPEATATTVDAEGWLHTGDIGYADEDGQLFIVDRVKELIKYKGFQVAPAELEAILLSHPAVADAALIPSPDEEAGEIPKAFVVLRGVATAAELMKFVAARVAPHKKIRKLEFIEQIPKSASGKILRRVLVERERQAINRSQ